MKKNHFKILILGATGMLGRTIYKYLASLYGKAISGTSRNKKNNVFINFIFRKSSGIDKLFHERKFEYVINCIAALEDSGKAKLKLLNVNLPRSLSKASKRYGFKIIHFSTDAVFKNHCGIIDERSKPSPEGNYGKSKLLGETSDALNIRTSILGFDPFEHKGLLEFVIKQKTKEIIGFTNQKWSGATTLQLAQLTRWLVSDKNFKKITKKTNIIHFSPLGPTTKHEIVKVFSKMINGLNVRKGRGPKKITRVLKTIYVENLKLDRYTNSLEKALKDLIKFDQNYAESYKEN